MLTSSRLLVFLIFSITSIPQLLAVPKCNYDESSETDDFAMVKTKTRLFAYKGIGQVIEFSDKLRNEIPDYIQTISNTEREPRTAAFYNPSNNAIIQAYGHR